MAGLLDSLMGSSIDDPKTMGLLQLAASLSSGQKFMPALSEGLLGRAQIMSSAERQKAAQQMQQMQMQQAQRQMAQQQAQDQFRASIPSPQMQAAQGALAGGGGPTMANAQRMQPVDPMAQLRHGAMQVGLGDPMEYLASLQPKPRKLTTVAPGASVIDENDPSRALFTAPKEANKPSALQEYEYAKGQGYGGSYLDFQLAQKRAGASNTSVSYGAPMAGVDARGNPVFFQPSRDGSAPAIVPGISPPKAEKPLTEAQAKAAAFASQMLSAEQAFQGAGTVGSNLSDQVQTRIAQGAGNFVVTPEAQKTRQAQEQWSEAFLRFKTGAAATEGEVVRNVRTYFPQPGDSAAVVAQKAEMRKQAAHDVRINAGNAQIESVTQQKKQVARTGTQNGRKVVQYADGTIEYAKD